MLEWKKSQDQVLKGRVWGGRGRETEGERGKEGRKRRRRDGGERERERVFSSIPGSVADQL
jgi:hypothetical protein